MLLYEEPDLVIRVVRDLFNEDFRELVIQGDDAYDEVESYLGARLARTWSPGCAGTPAPRDVFAE